MKLFPLAIFVFVLSFGTRAMASEATVYTTYLLPHHYDAYAAMLEAHDGADPWEIDDLGAVATSRDQAEPLLLAAAAVLGGCQCRVDYKPYPNHTSDRRSIIQVQNGSEIAHGIAGFTRDSRYEEGVLFSDPIWPVTAFYAGFYTHESRDDLRAITDEASLRDLRYVAAQDWEANIALLTAHGLTKMVTESSYNLPTMLEKKRADVVLLPFANTPDMAHRVGAGADRLVPIPGFKMLFGEARRFVVSETHPDGERFLAALNRGLAILDENGTIERAMVHAGVVNPNIAGFSAVDFAAPDQPEPQRAKELGSNPGS